MLPPFSQDDVRRLLCPPHACKCTAPGSQCCPGAAIPARRQDALSQPTLPVQLPRNR
jgi:hypothetical protein